eukprot:403350256
MEYDIKINSMNEKKDMLENYEIIKQQIDDLNKYSMIHEIGLKGFLTINDWFDQLTNERTEKIIEQSQKFISEILDQYDQINNQKLDNFLREQVIIKSQVDSFKEIRQQLQVLSTKIDEKATYQNLRNLEYQLEDYVKFNALKAVADTINSKSEQVDTDLIKAELRSSQNHIIQIQQIINSQQVYQEKIEQNLIDNSQESTKTIKKLDAELKKQKEELTTRINSSRDMLKNYMREQEVQHQETYNKLEQRATLHQLHELKDYIIDKYALQTSLRDLRREVIPPINEFRKTMDEYNDGYAQMQQMVRRFDEVLSEKASKMSINELQYFVECNYVKKKYWDKLQEEINKTIEQQQQTVKVMQESVKMFEVNMSEEISNAVKKSLTKTMANYEKVLNQFQKFFDQEELNKILERKCDIEVVQTLQDIKANKIDLEACLGLIDSVHSRLKHMSILTVELARSLLPMKSSSNFDTQETKNALINRRDFLFKQAQVTAAWIEDFKIKQMQPGEQETITPINLCQQNNQQLHQKLSRVETSTRIKRQLSVQISDIPESLRKFEKYHGQMQNLMRHDMPQTLKKLKNHLTNRASAQHNSLQKQSVNSTHQDFYEMFSNFSDPQFIQDKKLQNASNNYHLDYRKSLQHIQTRLIKKSNQSMRVSLNNSPTTKDLRARDSSQIQLNNNNNNESYDLSMVLGGHGEISVNKLRHLSAGQYTPTKFYDGQSINQFSTSINKDTALDDQTAKRITIFRNNLHTKGSLNNVKKNLLNSQQHHQQQFSQFQEQPSQSLINGFNDEMATGQSKYLNDSQSQQNQSFSDVIRNKNIANANGQSLKQSSFSRGIKTAATSGAHTGVHSKQYGI